MRGHAGVHLFWTFVLVCFFVFGLQDQVLAINWNGEGRDGERLEWPKDNHGVAIIPVCFANVVYTPQLQASIWIRDEVEGKWGRYGNLRFVRWDACQSTDTAGIVRVTINFFGVLGPWWSHSDIGSRPGYPTDMVINIVGLCGHYLDPSSWGFTDEGCARRLALHEFGHALGFGHEQAVGDNWRHGKPVFCDKLDPSGADVPGSKDYFPPVTLGTRYDRQSVMNYCNPDRSELSALDIIGLQAVYGRKTPGSLVGRGGRNLDVPPSSDENGTPTWIWENSGTVSQQWSYDVDNGTFSALGKCLDGETRNASQTYITDCTTRFNRSWDFRDFPIRAFGEKCLNRKASGRADGTPVQLRFCTGQGNQRWTYMPGGIFQTGPGGASAKCLDTLGLKARGQVYISTCRTDAFQQFDLLSSGQILARGSGLCLDVRDSRKMDTTAIQLDYCKTPVGIPKTGEGVLAKLKRYDLLNQQFNFTTDSRFRTSTGKCLDAWVTGEVSTNGIPTNINECNGYRNQIWDYYFSAAGLEMVQSDLSIEKMAVAVSDRSGARIIYKITLTNNGPDTATDVHVRDELPLGIINSAVHTEAPGSDLHIQLDNIVSAFYKALAPDDPKTITITAPVDCARLFGVLNSVSVQASTPDPDPSNNEAAVSIQAPCP